MAVQNVVFAITREAENDLSAKQHYAVELSASNQADVCDAQGELSIGILQNKPEANEAASIAVLGITEAITHDTNIVAGSELTVDANGKLEVAQAGDYVLAIALEAASATDDILSVLLVHHGVK